MKKQSIINELFLLNESIKSLGDCKDYEKALEKVCMKEESFMKQIIKYPNLHEAFCQFKQCIDDLHLVALYLYYKKGFLDGFNLSEELEKWLKVLE